MSVELVGAVVELDTDPEAAVGVALPELLVLAMSLLDLSSVYDFQMMLA
jgi:hypothetical protein